MRDLTECQSYVTQRRAEYRRFHTLLHDIEGKLENVVTHPSETERQSLVLEFIWLRDDLQRHFAEEEAGGCLEEAVGSSSALCHEATALVREHSELLAELDLAISAARDSNPDSSFENLRNDFRKIFIKLRAHEEAENRLLAQGFGIELDEIE